MQGAGCSGKALLIRLRGERIMQRAGCPGKVSADISQREKAYHPFRERD